MLEQGADPGRDSARHRSQQARATGCNGTRAAQALPGGRCVAIYSGMGAVIFQELELMTMPSLVL